MAEPSESETPEFWNVRYGSGDTPWTLPTISKDLESFIARRRSKGSVLIPGCGVDHEVIRRFDAAGFDVRAIDFSPVAVQQAQAAVGFLRNRIILGDFFAYDFGTKFDLIYERTFLCALPPFRWKNYADRVTQLLRPEGKLVGFFFYGNEPDPPPYGLSEEQATDLFGAQFKLVRDDAVSDSLPMFAGNERWQEWAVI